MANNIRIGAGRGGARQRSSHAARHTHLLNIKRARVDSAVPRPSDSIRVPGPDRPPTGEADTVSPDRPDSFAAVRAHLAAIRNPEPGSDFVRLAAYERDLLAVMVVWDDFCDRGEILHDGYTAYLFVSESKRLIAIDGGVEFRNWLTQYALLPGDALSKKTRETIGGRAMDHGRKVTLRSVAYFDKSTRKAYLNLGRGLVCRISTQQIEQVDNGTDGVLFLAAGQQPFDIDFRNLPECQYGLKVDTESRLCKTFNANWLTDPEDQHQLYLCRLLALLFPGMFGADPIVMNVGEFRSGKTSAAAKVGLLLIGEEFHVTMLNRNVKDVETTLTNKFFVVFDNTDSQKSVSDIEDLVALTATRGAIERRKYYSDNEMFSRPIISQTYFTTFNYPQVLPLS
jgi:hypothetical protein